MTSFHAAAKARKHIDDDGREEQRKKLLDQPSGLHEATISPVIVGELTRDTRSIKQQFSKLAAATTKSLRSRGIVGRQLLAAIEPEIALQCDSGSTVAEAFASLCSHISFFNYEPLEQIIKEFEDQNVLKKLEDYKYALDSYCRNPLRQLPANSLTKMDQNHRKTNATFVCVKLDAEWDNATLADIQIFRQKFAKIFDIKESLLNLHSVEEGCILVKFHVPTSVAKSVFQHGLSGNHKRELQHADVFQLVCYPYLSWSSKHVFHSQLHRKHCLADKNSPAACIARTVSQVYV